MTRHAFTPTRVEIIEQAKATANNLLLLRRSRVLGGPWRKDLQKFHPTIEKRVREVRDEMINVEIDLFRLADEMKRPRFVQHRASNMHQEARMVGRMLQPSIASVGTMYQLLQSFMDTYDETASDVSARFEIPLRSMRNRLEVVYVSMMELASLLRAL